MSCFGLNPGIFETVTVTLLQSNRRSLIVRDFNNKTMYDISWGFWVYIVLYISNSDWCSSGFNVVEGFTSYYLILYISRLYFTPHRPLKVLLVNLNRYGLQYDCDKQYWNRSRSLNPNMKKFKLKLTRTYKPWREEWRFLFNK